MNYSIIYNNIFVESEFVYFTLIVDCSMVYNHGSSKSGFVLYGL